ncbi:SDR family NAD(P)-dependent oxidoreductase [Yoonia sediminilitoris]|uniref:NAD(P)-dependent dehydrogenase (Short-subunit alcohol dehydrogenase family) n=1 Tax=Yoonia sediminilitoris TaxID=1286148 RepID=A0A2T6KK08_9RHOB|nr:SDR family NAD(P)-dependent oxidoreductase [Yoonia sediminilitoris]PUB16286.1 NAD(P)-dependent dehydrogenase (short-subunit alcohol dehydrogenase family) [Yoonia sediminilitoris]RCW96635.1 NAD(P)-dependent dehydrogenase (short-subunit alcohol dehydrogenase family) [Yoonia sediminilitoris]
MTTLITGANRGIGKALREQYASLGRTVIGTHRAPAADGMLQLDVTEPASQASMAALVQGPLDLLICNAGVYLDKGQDLASGYPPRMWADSFATNVTGVFLTIQHLLPKLQQAQSPKIAIISSQMASDTHAPGGSYIYRASKAAALNLGRNLATDLKPQGIAVGIYHPGWVQTDMGGSAAAIDAQTAAAGLVARFDALSLATTGCFETWDGQPHPY